MVRRRAQLAGFSTTVHGALAVVRGQGKQAAAELCDREEAPASASTAVAVAIAFTAFATTTVTAVTAVICTGTEVTTARRSFPSRSLVGVTAEDDWR